MFALSSSFGALVLVEEVNANFVKRSEMALSWRRGGS